ncbi:ANTAR domain-containing protein [Rhodococcus rhodnii]|nr:hypothetical protein [Rhodococcus rhodnii]TXG89716.1 ANTAR domain-containing protein [Rhodococcus rhodnii]
MTLAPDRPDGVHDEPPGGSAPDAPVSVTARAVAILAAARRESADQAFDALLDLSIRHQVDLQRIGAALCALVEGRGAGTSRADRVVAGLWGSVVRRSR